MTRDGDAELTAIVAAMEEEIAPLRARLLQPTATSVGQGRVTLARLGGAPVALMVTGDGERNARVGLAALLAKLPVRRVIVVGIAGALSPELGVAAIVIGDRVVDERGGRVYRAPAPLARAAEGACGARRAVVVTARRIADSAAEKLRLVAASRAAAERDGQDWPAVVDLESAAFAAEAERAGLPWLVLRAVSDTASEALPPLLNRSRDDGGAVRRARVVLSLLAEPQVLPKLLELRSRVRVCADHLARALELTVRELTAPPLGASVMGEARGETATVFGRDT